METYTVKDTDIVYETSVNFGTRQVPQDIHIVQYDSSQPIIAVELYKNSKKFVLPDGYEANIRWGKKDRTFIYKAVLGCNTDRTVLYFAVDVQMTLLYGNVQSIIELTCNGAVVGSSSIPVVIDRNPIQIGDIESKSDYPAIVERISAAETNATEAKEQSLDRHAIIDIIDALKGLGVDVSSVKSFVEYAEYNSEMEKIKDECRTQERFTEESGQ